MGGAGKTRKACARRAVTQEGCDPGRLPTALGCRWIEVGQAGCRAGEEVPLAGEGPGCGRQRWEQRWRVRGASEGAEMQPAGPGDTGSRGEKDPVSSPETGTSRSAGVWGVFP